MLRYIFNRTLGGALATLVVMAASSASAEKLDLSEGTMSISGRAQITYKSGDITALGTFAGDLDWGFGYFIADNFQLGFDIRAGGDFTKGGTFKGGLGPTLLYAFDTDSMLRPYLELGANVNWWQGGGLAGADRWSIGVDPGLGVLIGLNSFVALDLGLQVRIDVPVSGAPASTNTAIDAAIGHVGFRGFF